MGEGTIRLTASLAQLLAPLLAAAGSGRTRRGWALLAGSAGSWAVGQATWVWYEHVDRREGHLPDRSSSRAARSGSGPAWG